MLTYAIDVDAGIITLEGPDSRAEDLDGVLRRIIDDPRYRWGFALLRDRRGLPAPSAERVSGAVHVISRLAEFRTVRIAVVIARNDPEHYGAMRMLQLLGAGELEVGIFYDIDAARLWLSASAPRAATSASSW